MSVLAKAYVEQVAEGIVPDPDSEEAKEYRAWSWAQAVLKEIGHRVDRGLTTTPAGR